MYLLSIEYDNHAQLTTAINFLLSKKDIDNKYGIVSVIATDTAITVHHHHNPMPLWCAACDLSGIHPDQISTSASNREANLFFDSICN